MGRGQENLSNRTISDRRDSEGQENSRGITAGTIGTGEQGQEGQGDKGRRRTGGQEDRRNRRDKMKDGTGVTDKTRRIELWRVRRDRGTR